MPQGCFFLEMFILDSRMLYFGFRALLKFSEVVLYPRIIDHVSDYNTIERWHATNVLVA